MIELPHEGAWLDFLVRMGWTQWDVLGAQPAWWVWQCWRLHGIQGRYGFLPHQQAFF